VARNLVTVSNSLVAAIVDGVGAGDDERRALLASARIQPDAVRDVHGRTSIVALARLWRRVMRATDDDFVGLRIGSSVRGDRFGLAVHAAQHADDFRAVLVQFAKYATLVNDLMECKLEVAPPVARFVARLHWNVLRLERHAVDITFAAVAAFARDRLAERLVVREVRLVHNRVAGRAVYERLFGAPLVLGANRNELVFDAAILDAPVADRDPELGALLDRYASLELARIPVVTDLPARIAQVVRRQLVAGTAVELAAIAKELEMTARTLQRHLAAHATSFTVLLDEQRRALAPEMLAEPGANVEQVGFRLGYSEPTAFIRAFKKWYGTTPGNYRRGANLDS
jgi:AraC-like DNA-binding protein